MQRSLTQPRSVDDVGVNLDDNVVGDQEYNEEQEATVVPEAEVPEEVVIIIDAGVKKTTRKRKRQDQDDFVRGEVAVLQSLLQLFWAKQEFYNKVLEILNLLRRK